MYIAFRFVGAAAAAATFFTSFEMYTIVATEENRRKKSIQTSDANPYLRLFFYFIV